MTNEAEKIEADEQGDNWRCMCGNRPWEQGFYSIDEGVQVVDPDEEHWRTNEYVCAQCGRVIEGTTHVVTRRVDLAATISRST